MSNGVTRCAGCGSQRVRECRIFHDSERRRQAEKGELPPAGAGAGHGF